MASNSNHLFSELEGLIQEAEKNSLPELMGNVERIRGILLGRLLLSSNAMKSQGENETAGERYLRPEKAASLLDLPLSTVYFLVKKGKIPHKRFGKHIRIPVESIINSDFQKDLGELDNEEG